ncbi:hypothetical protein EVC45_26100 [Paraburkholderia sp. UYCP14C]|uniref:hypothetical protein n=1 Tax=Paraburkholderia sp. UYCP14C TaxID=2511130 RepID=UPI0010207907|nr:hypothetical protein [Paraburkholderia sp. UYCP14C]RZF26806.1 hypothetical protein EVC45_26100 [Paraburkholderia sp. UYCP14C]
MSPELLRSLLLLRILFARPVEGSRRSRYYAHVLRLAGCAGAARQAPVLSAGRRASSAPRYNRPFAAAGGRLVAGQFIARRDADSFMFDAPPPAGARARLSRLSFASIPIRPFRP